MLILSPATGVPGKRRSCVCRGGVELTTLAASPSFLAAHARRQRRRNQTSQPGTYGDRAFMRSKIFLGKGIEQQPSRLQLW